MIQLENIHKSFGNLEVLRGVSLSVAKGEVVSIVGASGAGKSTLLNIMGSLMEPSGGKVMIAGTDIFSLPDKSLAAFRNREIGFVFQFHHLLPEFTALENVMMPALIGGAKWGSREVEARARLLLEDLGVGERLQHKPGQLSGGEQQRVAIARALMNNPAVLLADEPSGNLDSRNKEELHKLFFMLREKYGQTIVIVTHEMELARMCDRCIEMKDGQILGHEGEPCLENRCIEIKDGQILGSGGGAVSGKCGFSAQHNSHTGCSCGEHSTHKTL